MFTLKVVADLTLSVYNHLDAPLSLYTAVK